MLETYPAESLLVRNELHHFPIELSMWACVRFDDELFTQLMHLINCMNCALN
jgi:hypothetical protein